MKVFISYHLLDRKYRIKTENILKHYNIDYYVVPENIDFNGKSHQFIEDFLCKEIKKCDILLCLIGKETYSRPHVDRELHTALKGDITERLGIIGVHLDTRTDSLDTIDLNTFPKKLWDNKNYVIWTNWKDLNSNLLELLDFAIKNAKNNKIITNHSNKCLQLRGSRYYSN